MHYKNNLTHCIVRYNLVGKSSGMSRSQLQEPYILICVFICCSVAVSGGGGSQSLGAALVCARAAGLTERQRAMCRASPAAVAAIGDGLR